MADKKTENKYGYILLYPEDFKDCSIYEEYRDMPDAYIINKNTSDEFIKFITVKLEEGDE